MKQNAETLMAVHTHTFLLENKKININYVLK